MNALTDLGHGEDMPPIRYQSSGTIAALPIGWEETVGGLSRYALDAVNFTPSAGLKLTLRK
jgi:hypothetical protein